MKQDEINKLLIQTVSDAIALVSDSELLHGNHSFLDFLEIKQVSEFAEKYKTLENVIVENEHSISSDNMFAWVYKIDEGKNLLRLKSSSGEERYFRIDVSHIDGFYVLVDYDKTFEYKHGLENALYTNSLTSLPNRNKLINDLTETNNKISAIAVLDIKSFKEVNDFYGNQTGDFILKSVAELIKENIDPALELYKTQADTYCVANSKLHQMKFKDSIAKAIRAVDDKVFIRDHQEISVKLTGGISLSPKNNKLVTADLALVEAKKLKKDYLVFYTDLDNIDEFKNNMEWTKKLKKAIAEDNIVVYYQPLINNKTMIADKFECLVRMVDEDRIISPFFFLGVSKKSNQYHMITRIVIQKAFETFKDLPAHFSVNISYEDIISDGFYKYCEDKIKEFNIADRVVFEILEDESVEDYDILIAFINKLKKLGCEIAIDDFGTGYSNFEHILKMDIDYLKIDASIIKHIATDENSLQVTKTIVNFAKNLNLKIIAEYVENYEIFEIVKNLGIDYSQGFHFSAPIESPLPFIERIVKA